MEQSSFVKAAMWTVAILAIVLVIYPSKVFAFQGSPVTVSDGSIKVKTTSPQSWSSSQGRIPVTGKPNMGQLYFDGLPGLPPSQGFSGWIINISNRKKDGATEKTGAIKICSSSDCSGKSLDPDNKVYLYIRTGSWWKIVNNQELHFHDSECDGPPGQANPPEDRHCDFPAKVYLKGTDNSGKTLDANGACANDGNCYIGIGPRQ